MPPVPPGSYAYEYDSQISQVRLFLHTKKPCKLVNLVSDFRTCMFLVLVPDSTAAT